MLDEVVKSCLKIKQQECVVPKGSDESLLGKMQASHSSNRNFAIARKVASSFSIVHFAGSSSLSSLNY